MKYLLMIVLLFSFGQANAELDGNQLLERCESYLSENGDAVTTINAFDKGICSGFIDGISGAHKTFTDWEIMSPQWCAPDNVTQGQVARILVKSLREYPEDLHLTASGLVANALILAFPCE